MQLKEAAILMILVAIETLRNLVLTRCGFRNNHMDFILGSLKKLVAL